MARRPGKGAGGFSLIELLVSMAVLAVVLAILLRMFGQVSDMWRQNRARIESFQSARAAFERVTRQLSQATLDTYLDYFNGTESRTDKARDEHGVPDDFNATSYDWASDLQFITDKATTLVPAASGDTPTQAVFFVAPTGNVASAKYRRLDNLLNAIGYYIEYVSDKKEIPPFLQGTVKERFRYRLIELNQPSEKLSIYGDNGSGAWYKQAIESPDDNDSSTFILADNVIALIIRPRASSAEQGTPAGNEIERDYAYDSKKYLQDGSSVLKNQLPPLVQVTMVTIDEASADRYARKNGDSAPNFVEGLFDSPTEFDSDLKKLEDRLTDQHLEFRVFTTDVSLRGAKSNLN